MYRCASAGVHKVRPDARTIRVKRAKVGQCPAYISVLPSDNPEMAKVEVFNFHSHSHIELIASRRPSAFARDFVLWRVARGVASEHIVRQASEAMRGTNDVDLINAGYVAEQGDAWGHVSFAALTCVCAGFHHVSHFPSQPLRVQYAIEAMSV